MDSHFTPSSANIAFANAQMERLQQAGGIAFGYHGTSVSAARAILASGFQNRQPSRLDQMSAVYFTEGIDEKSLLGAREYGINKALWRNEREYAVILAKFRNPDADFMTGQSLWAVQAQNIMEYSVSFYAVPEEFQPTFLMRMMHKLCALFSRDGR